MKFYIFYLLLFLSIPLFAYDYQTVDSEKLNNMIESSNKQKNGEVEKNIGTVFYRGNKFIKPNIQKAEEWWLKSANKGFVLSQLKLASLYCFFSSNKNKYKEGRYWLLKAKSTGDPESEIAYGILLWVGQCGFKQDIGKGKKIVFSYANKGHIDAEIFLAEHYGDKVGRNNIAYSGISYKYGKKVFEKGHPVGLYNLCKAYSFGQHVKLNRDLGYQYCYMGVKSGYFGGTYLSNLKKLKEFNRKGYSDFIEEGMTYSDKYIKKLEIKADFLMKQYKIKKFDKPKLN